MYTTIHPHYNKITFNDSLFNKDFRKEVEESVFIKSYNDFLIYPNQNTLQSLILNTTFSDRDSLTVKIHDLEIDINNNTATYGKVVFLNTTIEKINKFSNHELIGKSILIFLTLKVSF